MASKKSVSEELGITLKDARRIIQDDDAGYALWSMAAGVILDEADNNPELFTDLLQCLERGGPCIGAAVVGLYTRSGRPWPENCRDHCRDPEDWRNYLINANLLKRDS